MTVRHAPFPGGQRPDFPVDADRERAARVSTDKKWAAQLRAEKIIWRIAATNSTGSAEGYHGTIDEAGEAVKRLLEQGYAVSVAAHELGA